MNSVSQHTRPNTSGQSLSPSLKTEPTGEQDPNDVSPTSSTRRSKLWLWTSTLWPLILHCLTAIGVVMFMVYYVNGNDFNLTARRPSAPLADGTIVRWKGYAPLQSDITTILSTTLMVLRWILAAWAGPLCWRSAFLLMERTGLRRRELKCMIGLGLFAPSNLYKHFPPLLVGIILLVTFSAQSAAPILTGSITWAPSSLPAVPLSDDKIEISVAGDAAYWFIYHNASAMHESLIMKAAGFANVAWGRDLERGTLKRVLPSTTRLNVNSTIENVTLPYFSVTAFEWLSDPLKTFDMDVVTLMNSALYPFSGVTRLSLMMVPGTLVVLPRAYQVNSSSPYDFPSPIAISNRSILLLNLGKRDFRMDCQPGNVMISQITPPNMGFVDTNISCYAFARVGYSAGVATCTDCRLALPATVQNDSSIALQEDPMTGEALWQMSNVTANLVAMNSSVPFPWNNIDGYVVEVLVRSYSAAWIALNEFIGQDVPPLTSSFSTTLPSTRAMVDLTRLYAWFIMQLLVTTGGLVFLLLQSMSNNCLIGDTTMVAFDLDTTEAPKHNASSGSDSTEVMKIEPKGDGWKVVVDPRVA